MSSRVVSPPQVDRAGLVRAPTGRIGPVAAAMVDAMSSAELAETTLAELTLAAAVSVATRLGSDEFMFDRW